MIDVQFFDCERDEEHQFDLSKIPLTGLLQEEEALKNAMRMVEKISFRMNW